MRSARRSARPAPRSCLRPPLSHRPLLDLRLRPGDRVDRGGIVLRPGKEGRLGEADAPRPASRVRGRRARLNAPATAEGRDLLWLDEQTLLVGRGYRTSDEGIHALDRRFRPSSRSLSTCGSARPDGVIHLLSLLSPLDEDLVATPPLLPVRLVQLLTEREIRIVEIPDDEFETMGATARARTTGRARARRQPRDPPAPGTGRRRRDSL